MEEIGSIRKRSVGKAIIKFISPKSAVALTVSLIITIILCPRLFAQSDLPIGGDDATSIKVDYPNRSVEFSNAISLTYYTGDRIDGYGGRFMVGPEFKKMIHFGIAGDWGYLGNGFLLGISANGRFYPRMKSVFPFAAVSAGMAYESLVLDEAQWNFFFDIGAGLGAPLPDFEDTRLLFGASYRYDASEQSSDLMAISLGFMF